MTGAAHLGAIIVTSSTPLWYATRATGLVAMVLLTASMALGLLSSVRFQRPAWPRFVTLGLHRNLSLLALGFTAVHVLTTVLDSFVSIPLQDAFVPFISSYRPIWVGLGAIGLDLMLALTVTSLLADQDGPAQLASGALDGLPVLAGGSAARTRDRHGYSSPVGARPDRVLRSRRCRANVLATGPGMARSAGSEHRGRRTHRGDADRWRSLAAGRTAVPEVERPVRHAHCTARGSGKAR